MIFPETWWGVLLSYVTVFASGGLLCMLAQVLIIKTRLTPARILVIFLIAGIILQTVGLYEAPKARSKRLRKRACSERLRAGSYKRLTAWA